VMLSEYPLGTPPLAANFPKRNRLIAALSRGTLVVEAALASGSLVTARLAAEQGKEVLAIPGSIHSPQSKGCHALIRQGAKLVETVHDILEELPVASSHPVQLGLPMPPGGEETDSDAVAAIGDEVLEALGQEPCTLDTLQARCGWPTPALQARLLTLELNGQLSRLPGGRFQRIGMA
jgi:DNA processing protein